MLLFLQLFLWYFIVIVIIYNNENTFVTRADLAINIAVW